MAVADRQGYGKVGVYGDFGKLELHQHYLYGGLTHSELAVMATCGYYFPIHQSSVFVGIQHPGVMLTRDEIEEYEWWYNVFSLRKGLFYRHHYTCPNLACRQPLLLPRDDLFDLPMAKLHCPVCNFDFQFGTRAELVLPISIGICHSPLLVTLKKWEEGREKAVIDRIEYE